MADNDDVGINREEQKGGGGNFEFPLCTLGDMIEHDVGNDVANDLDKPALLKNYSALIQERHYNHYLETLVPDLHLRTILR